VHAPAHRRDPHLHTGLLSLPDQLERLFRNRLLEVFHITRNESKITPDQRRVHPAQANGKSVLSCLFSYFFYLIPDLVGHVQELHALLIHGFYSLLEGLGMAGCDICASIQFIVENTE